MRFDYYRRLSPELRRVYDKSDAIVAMTLPRLAEHRARTAALREALASGERKKVEAAARELTHGITLCLGCPSVTVRVLARRPKNHGGELHGLYTQEADGRAHIEVWMRTAEHERVVAFRTFLRTLVHEIGHHLDLVHFGLKETFHTAGFFRRESSLTRQLLTGSGPERRSARPAPEVQPKSSSRERRRRPEQLSLFS